MKKICYTCHEAKPTSDFYGRENQCRPCRIERQNERRRERKAAGRLALAKHPAFSEVAQKFCGRRA